MKPLHWLVLIPLLAGAAFLATRQIRMTAGPAAQPHRGDMGMSATPEGGLLWLKSEYHLSDAEYERVRVLHDGYLPGCQERCGEIARVNEDFFALIQKNTSITSEVKAKLEEAARLRARCKELMLAHFYEVAAVMPPVAAGRYLEWVARETLMD